MNSHVRIDTESATLVTDTKPSLSQLLYTHEKLCNLARGPLSGGVVGQMRETAKDLLSEIASAPALSWPEFGKKVSLFFGELTNAPTDEWLEAIQLSVYDDIYRLNRTVELAQAAE
jgi:hypothetical protein